MSTTNRDRGAERNPLPRWVWLNLAAFGWGLLLILLAFTLHDRGSPSDPEGIFHKYTLYHDLGPGIVPFVALPAIASLILFALLYLKSARRSYVADRAAWTLVVIVCVAALAGLLVQGLVVLPATVLIVAATATTPVGADPATR